ncbi:MCE family protein [Actinocorallia longicatena]|uniref:Phospholipid/cholesterol/gamma-HCH transport system substrate-binding protein n=1 Tax=Actinocorallia longicatena TaxID=111803 RepID=A0ABP6Q4W1_9ACTN
MRSLLMTIALCAALAGCSLQTLHAPKGDVTVVADFSDVQNLLAGHSVKIADVTVGSVTGIELVGNGGDYRSRVTMSIKKRLPAGTTAEVTVTSLLGENYVRLAPPAGVSLEQGPFLANGATIAATSVSPGFEDIVGKSAPLIDALARGDVPGLVQAGSIAFAARGPELKTLIANAGTLLKTFGEHRRELESAVDDLAALGKKLAQHDDALNRLPDRLQQTTAVLAGDRKRILDAVHSLSSLAESVNDSVLVGHTRKLRTMIEQIGPTFAVLAADKTKLANLIAGVQELVERMPRQVYNGQMLTYPIVQFDGDTYRGEDPKPGDQRSPATLADLVRMLGPRP